jgi:cell division protein ZipA
MATGFRIFLLLLGVIIVMGIVWDFKKNRRKSNLLVLQEKQDPYVAEYVEESDDDDEEMDEEGELIVLQVMARDLKPWDGRKLIDVFNQACLYYGDRQIFHRHENMDGSGEVIFSMASAIEPGYFATQTMLDYKTPGLTLFFTTTHPNQSIAAFELMLRIAKQLAQNLGGEVCDDKRKPLTIRRIEEYREQVRVKNGLKAAI